MQHTFKVGDKVKVKPYSEFDFTDELYEMTQQDVFNMATSVFTVIKIDSDGDLLLDTCDVIDYYFAIHPQNVIPTSTKNPRPHAELIKQWADDDSLEIEVYCEVTETWIGVNNVIWSECNDYRIKPKTVTKWKWAYNSGQTDASILTGNYFADEEELKKYYNGKVAKAIKLDWTEKEFEV